MPDDNAAGQAPAGEGQVPAEQTTDHGQESGEQWDPERALHTIRTLRAEAKAAKAQYRELEQLRQEKQEREHERLSDHEKLQKRTQQLEADLRAAQQQHQERELDWALERAATRVGCADPEAARLLLRQSDLLEVGEDGRPKNADQALKALLKERPWLAAQQQTPPMSLGNGATRTSQPGQRTYTRSELADYAFYQKNRDDIMVALREGRITEG